ncbi:MAG: excinuclease ABC subunit UvrC [Oscillospiraceae bacterium]|jgi:excinuclease ABC subunit C|nr:excinuclease ABC subunit UvrC [Oscillospiraceae bacterium]
MTKLQSLKQKALSLPLCPGVYIMMNASAEILYIGKAKMLKHRVSQYFQDSAAHSAKTAAMVSQVDDFDTIVADSEFEALVLECSLIKRHQPRYNILLKDDKGYPFIRLSAQETYPRFTLANKWKNDGARYFGPYGGRQTTQRVVEAVCGVFRLPVCRRQFPRDIGRERPCLQYHMGCCLAPCRGGVAPEEMRAAVRQAVSVLEGKYLAVADELRAEMERAAEALLFEKAAQLRDRLNGIVRLGARQKVVSGSMADTDVIGVCATEAKTCLAVLHFIDGALFDRDVTVVGQELSGEACDTVSSFVKQFYLPRRAFPRQILLPCTLEDGEAVAAWLGGLAGYRVELVVPKRGEKRRLVEMAENNAREEAVRLTTAEERVSALTTALQRMLGLAYQPRRLEAYDISHTGGRDTVGAMVVFTDTAPRKKDYRRFLIRASGASDDYDAMREMLIRRFARLKAGDKGFAEAPDLLLIDGGQAHAAVALSVLAACGLDIPVYGMVKDDRHRTRALISPEGREVGIQAIPALFSLIGRIQEETHRFAVTYHHVRRGKQSIRSGLDSIPGLGPARRAALLRHFKLIRHIRAASPEELAAVLPKPVAQAVYIRFHPSPEALGAPEMPKIPNVPDA